jgi:agmatine/peptidylarginine deiminase
MQINAEGSLATIKYNYGDGRELDQHVMEMANVLDSSNAQHPYGEDTQSNYQEQIRVTGLKLTELRRQEEMQLELMELMRQWDEKAEK